LTRLRHFDDLGTARFVTFSTFHRLPVLAESRIAAIVLEEVEGIRVYHSIQVLAYVIMPDHVHLVLLPPEGCSLGGAIGRMKGLSARRILPVLADDGDGLENRRRNGKRALWQRRCYDHNCRTVETVIEKINYCHNNPVTAGLVDKPGEWEWSSYHRYHGLHTGPVRVDTVTL